jgi:hypothetical protein
VIHVRLGLPLSFWWRSVWTREWFIGKHKVFELQLMRSSTLFEFSFDLRWWGRDHGGIYIDIGLLTFDLAVNFYDRRHWDFANACWQD